MQNHNDVVMAALAACMTNAKSAEVKRECPPGKHEINALVRVQGVLSKGEPEWKPNHLRIGWERLAAVLWSKVNEETRKAVLRDYLDDSLDTKDVKAEAKAAVESLYAKSEGWHSGRTRFRGDVEIVPEA